MLGESDILNKSENDTIQFLKEKNDWKIIIRILIFK